MRHRIDVGTGAMACVTIRNFDQIKMTVSFGGVSRVRGEGLQIADLTATVSGVRLLDRGGIPPHGNANVDVTGVSQATFNMGVESILAGSVSIWQGTGNSTLF